MESTRRDFLRATCAVALGFTGLRAWTGCTVADSRHSFGEIVRDPAGVIDLPHGFRYTSFSATGSEMADGLLVPGYHDGMGAFEGPDGQTIVVRNHEVPHTVFDAGPFGPNDERLHRIDRSLLYDGSGEEDDRPSQGGTTTFVFDTKTQTLVREFLSLGGTAMNCSGGTTPWGTWLSCEETTLRAGTYPTESSEIRLDRDHGYAFEVAATSDIGIVRARPLEALGRFVHEAAAVHARTGIVYLTEDQEDGLLYRFLPEVRGKLDRGGRLQALALHDRPGCDTSNRPAEGPEIARRKVLETHWIDVDDVASPNDDLRIRGREDGAAVFRRAEGMWADPEEIYFTCTQGGPHELGQVWRYVPSAFEGTAAESRAPGTLELFLEPRDKNLLSNADNLSIAPWGDLVICEDHVFPDGQRRHHLLGVTPRGELYPFARNALSDSEFAGCTFSPDGSTLFVNIQRPGLTLAITGPWPRPA